MVGNLKRMIIKGLICAAANGVEYSDAYEAVNKD